MPEVLDRSQNYMVSKYMLYSYIRDKFAMYQCQNITKLETWFFFHPSRTCSLQRRQWQDSPVKWMQNAWKEYKGNGLTFSFVHHYWFKWAYTRLSAIVTVFLFLKILFSKFSQKLTFRILLTKFSIIVYHKFLLYISENSLWLTCFVWNERIYLVYRKS